MGTILPKPILSKIINRAGNQDVASACCCMNGSRHSMEDAHCMSISPNRMIFGIFDGHSNENCSQYVAEKIPEKLLSEKGELTDDLIVATCLTVDQEYLDKSRDGGTTGTFCIFEKSKDSNKYQLIIANVGDSRTFVIRDKSIIFCTTDHKPINNEERQRIEKHGGVVRMNRVDGDLAVSRAFGDGFFKRDDNATPREQKVIAVPDIKRMDVEPGDIIVLACDGVFEGGFTTEEVMNFVISNLPTPGGDYGVVAARVCDMAIRRGSKDNISCMVVHVTDGSYLTDKYDTISFVPGPPFPKNHDASKKAYERMAKKFGIELPDALQKRYKLFLSNRENRLDELSPIEQISFEMSEDIDVSAEEQFFAGGPGINGMNETEFFISLAEGNR